MRWRGRTFEVLGTRAAVGDAEAKDGIGRALADQADGAGTAWQRLDRRRPQAQTVTIASAGEHYVVHGHVLSGGGRDEEVGLG